MKWTVARDIGEAFKPDVIINVRNNIFKNAVEPKLSRYRGPAPFGRGFEKCRRGVLFLPVRLHQASLLTRYAFKVGFRDRRRPQPFYVYGRLLNL
jgi:hypothetical protein